MPFRGWHPTIHDVPTYICSYLPCVLDQFGSISGLQVNLNKLTMLNVSLPPLLEHNLHKVLPFSLSSHQILSWNQTHCQPLWTILGKLPLHAFSPNSTPVHMVLHTPCLVRTNNSYKNCRSTQNTLPVPHSAYPGPSLLPQYSATPNLLLHLGQIEALHQKVSNGRLCMFLSTLFL